MTRPPAEPSPPAATPREAGPTPRTLLKDRAYRELKAMIQSGVFPPNAFLSERQLVRRLGMSKTPIRSALEHLEAQGLVAVSPQQGIVVRELSAREITELFDMREALEPYLAGRLASRPVPLGAEAAGRVEENLGLQRRAASEDDAEEATRLDVAFHMLLAELLDNREALAWLARCFDKLHRSILRVNRLGAGRLHQSVEEHAALAQAIRGGDAAESVRRMQAHLLYGRRFLLGG